MNLIRHAPQDADLLVLAGEIPGDWADALRAPFKTLALPRAAVWLPPPWPCAPPEGLPLTDDPRRALLDLTAAHNQALLEDSPRRPGAVTATTAKVGRAWPYGRPMAMSGPDADGLMLGAVPTSLGPFFSGLPSGLQLELTMQGDRTRTAWLRPFLKRVTCRSRLTG